MPFTAAGPSSQSTANNWSTAAGTSTSVFSRPLVPADNGSTIEADASVTYTVPASLPDGFGCAFLLLAGVTVTLASDGTSLLNGATTSVTRAQSANVMFAIQKFRTNPLNHAVTGS